MTAKRQSPVYTLSMLVEAYEREYVPLHAPETQTYYRWFVRKLLRDFGPLPLGELTPGRLIAWRDTQRQRCKSGTVRQYMEMLSGMLTVAVEDLGWVERNPLAKVPRPPASPDRVRYLDLDEQERLLQACGASSERHLYPLVLVALVTGARRGELFRLLWRDVDLERGYVRVTRSKNGERRAVPLAAVGVEVLAGIRGEAGRDAWVFPHKHTRTRFPYTWAWRKARAEAGLVDFRFHDLRHTAASYLFMSGADIKEVQEILGHKSLRMTLKYVHLSLPHTRHVVDRMAAEMLRP